MDRFWRSYLRLVVISALSLATSVISDGVRAEEDFRITNEIALMDVRVSPARMGGRAKITFLLENRSAERVSFRGMTIADAGQSRIVVSLGNGVTTTLDSLPIAPGETLSADGEALWIEVDGLAKDLRPGGAIEASVSFGTAVIPVSLMVEDGGKPSN